MVLRPGLGLCSDGQVSVKHYIDVIMTTMASQINSLTVVYSTVYSDADQRKHQSSASQAFVWGINRDRWIPRTNGQLRGKCFHLMTSSWSGTSPSDVEAIAVATVHASVVIAYSTTAVEVKILTTCIAYLYDNQLQSDVYIYTDKFTYKSNITGYSTAPRLRDSSDYSWNGLGINGRYQGLSQ